MKNKKRYLRPWIQDMLFFSIFAKFFILGIIDDYKVTALTFFFYVLFIVLMVVEIKLLTTYGRQDWKGSIFFDHVH